MGLDTRKRAPSLPCIPPHDTPRRPQEAVRTLKGEVAQEQGNIVSHVVHPAGEAGDAGGGQRYARTLEVRGKGLARVAELGDGVTQRVRAGYAAAKPQPDLSSKHDSYISGQGSPGPPALALPPRLV